LNNKQPVIIEHLAFLSVKHNVYLSELYNALVTAKETKGKCSCENLTVDCRGTSKGESIFLITKAGAVIMQFRVADDFLQRKNISFESWLNTDKVRRQVTKQNRGQDSTSIQSLRVGMKKVNLKAEVMEIKEPQMVNTQYGSRVKVTNVCVADETGRVNLCLWGEQAAVPAVGDVVQIKGASVRVFKGERFLSLGRSGTAVSQRPMLVDNRDDLA
jgi:hypothetical protein